jgi:hypothetical protein
MWDPPAKSMPSTKTVELMRTYKRIGMSEELFSRWARDVEIKDCKTSDSEEVEQRVENWLEMFRRLKVWEEEGEKARKVIGGRRRGKIWRKTSPLVAFFHHIISEQ